MIFETQDSKVHTKVKNHLILKEWWVQILKSSPWSVSWCDFLKGLTFIFDQDQAQTFRAIFLRWATFQKTLSPGLIFWSFWAILLEIKILTFLITFHLGWWILRLFLLSTSFLSFSSASFFNLKELFDQAPKILAGTLQKIVVTTFKISLSFLPNFFIFHRLPLFTRSTPLYYQDQRTQNRAQGFFRYRFSFLIFSRALPYLFTHRLKNP